VNLNLWRFRPLSPRWPLHESDQRLFFNFWKRVSHPTKSQSRCLSLLLFEDRKVFLPGTSSIFSAFHFELVLISQNLSPMEYAPFLLRRIPPFPFRCPRVLSIPTFPSATLYFSQETCPKVRFPPDPLPVAPDRRPFLRFSDSASAYPQFSFGRK